MTALHPAASRQTGTYVRILFVDFSSDFNTIIPDTLQNKLTQLSIPTSICQWINSFLTDRHTISTGAPQGCVLSPLLFSLYTNDCTSKDPSVKLLKFSDDTTLIGLIQESVYSQKVKELAVWCSLNNLELNTLKTVGMIRRNPPHEQHCDCSGVIQIPGHHHLPGPEVGHSHWVHCEKGPAEVVLPSSAEEVQPATGAAETVLLYHHLIRPLHVNYCLVQLSYQIWPQKTIEGSPDYWANHWYNLPQSPRIVLIQSEQKCWQNHSGPLTSSTFSLWTVTIWSTLKSSEHQNDQTPDTGTVSSFMQSISWTLNIKRGTWRHQPLVDFDSTFIT